MCEGRSVNARALVILLVAGCSGGLTCWSSGDRGRSGQGGSGGSSGGGDSGATAGGGGALTCADGTTGAAGAGGAASWVGTWATGPQLTEPGNVPPAPGLTNNTLRQIVFTSIGGQQLRLRLSNEFGDGPVTMNAVHVARSTGGNAIDAATDKALTFAGAGCVTIPVGQAVFSDAFAFDLPPLTKVAVTIAFGATPAGITGHPGSRTTSYLATGNVAAAASLSGAVSTEHWYYITGIDVVADTATAAVVTLGDSITDGRGTTTNENNRWPDGLSRRLQANAATNKIAVLNQGIGGNAVVSGGLGPTAMQRFARDVLGQRGVRWVIIFEGVNDIGGSSGQSVATNLINAFTQFVDMAHAAGIKAYGVPITPFGGSMYDSADHQTARATVNDWIRNGGKFDAVIDLDAAVRDPDNPMNLAAAYDTGDHLHLNPTGYQKMADAIDLALFALP
jgi:lysophospholipase L1-like esterase